MIKLKNNLHKMSIINNFVLLLKAQKSDDNSKDEYEDMLERKGYMTRQVKTLDFEYKNLDALNVDLSNPDLFSGIIFSSPRCVFATKLALNGAEIDPSWSLKKNYVVGATTAKYALTELGLHCEGQETGNGNNLADLMLNVKTTHLETYLFPHGNLNSDIIKNRFNGEICLHEVCVYNTIENPNLLNEIVEYTEKFNKIPEFIIFFSPSGVKSSFEHLQKMPLKNIKLIAIGPTTEAAMKQLNLDVFGTADRPTCTDLIKVMQR